MSDRHAAKSDTVDEDGLDGCDLDFKTAEQTNDEDLPPSFGGVE